MTGKQIQKARQAIRRRALENGDDDGTGTVEWLAEQIGVSPKTVVQWEWERYNIPLPTQKLLEKVLSGPAIPPAAGPASEA